MSVAGDQFKYVMQCLMAEAFARLAPGGDLHIHSAPPLSDSDAAALIRSHIIDRWNRFAEFGVTSRRDLAKLAVTIRPMAPRELAARWGGDVNRGTSTTVNFKGTPLEAHVR